MFRRPKPGESEEDILKEQEEFLNSKNQPPAASVINKRKTSENPPSGGSGDASKKPRSKFASRRAEKTPGHGEEKVQKSVGPDILGEILEKNMDNIVVTPPTRVTENGFPEVFLRDKTLVGAGKSIFAQQNAKLKGAEITMGTSQKFLIPNADMFGEKSFILTGAEAEKIHRENKEKLAGMKEEDILKEQQKLMAQMDPNLLAFLRSRRQAKQEAASKMETDEVGTSGIGKKPQEQVLETARDAEMESEPIMSEENEEEATKPVADSGMKRVSANLPFNPEEANRWLHMDIVEQDKLKWIGDIPAPPAVPVEAHYSARFNFQGLLLPYSTEEVDVRKALYHHGDEPERPGYTIQELLQLSRSSVLQQRVLALTTIANILDKTKAGYYDECLDTPLLHQLTDADLYLLLRFSLDDNAETIVTATLAALRNLLYNQPDEMCVDRLLGLWNGHLQPNLMAKIEVKKQSEKDELKEDEVEMKDHQILRLDMIKGALRTDLMLRLRYILEVLKPGPRAVINVLEILTRIVRHSHDAALAVTCCPRLVSTIISNFIPRDWRGIVGSSKPVDMPSVYGVPLVEALKLVRVIASCSRSMASDLVHKFGVMESVVSYISIDPRECGLPQQEAVRLSLESFYLWNTLLAYNFATSHFVDLYPVLMRLVQFHLAATSTADSGAAFGHEHGAALLSLLTQAMLVADAQVKRLASQKVANVTPRIPVTLTHEQLSGFSQPLHLCLKKWLNQLARAEDITFTALKLVSAALNCLAVQITKFHTEPDVDSVSMLEELQDLVKNSVRPLLCSSNFKMLCSRVKSSSCLLGKHRSGKDRDPSSLPSLGCLVWGGKEVMPSINATSPLPLLQGLAHFLTAVCAVHRGLHSYSIEHFLDNPRILEYVSELGNKPLQAGDNWFTRVESTMLAHMLQLLSVVLPTLDFQHVGVYHNLALRLIAVVPSDEKYLTKQIFTQVVFNPDFFRDCSDVALRLESLRLSEVALEQERASIHSLLEAATNRVTSFWQCYESALGLRAVSDCCPLDVNTQTASESGLEPAFPNDWAYLPVLKLYSEALSGKADRSNNTTAVVACLQWLLIVECLRPQSMATISVTARFCRLCTVFLAGNDLFLEPPVQHHLDALLRILLRNNSKLNFNENIPGLSSFYDLYTQLVEQFAGVSYGDELFGHFVLVPLQQRHSPSFRKLIWSEHAAVLRVLRTKPEQLAVPMKEFLEPCETEPSLIMCYFRGVMSGQVKEMWCPVLYRVALHQVSAFISQHSDTTLAQQLKAKIQLLGDKVPNLWRVEGETN